MQRIPEEELMNEAEQADAYARADFAEVNQGFVDHFLSLFPGPVSGRMVDLGCGPADIPIRFCRSASFEMSITAVDGAPAMLARAREDVAKAGLQDRITPLQGRLPLSLEDAFDAVVSNSLLHHLPAPHILWDQIKQSGKPGAAVFVMDLMRPDSKEQAQAIVERYSVGEPEVLRRDFYNSLLAAFTREEIRDQLRNHGLDLKVLAMDDRHLIVHGRLR